MHLHVIFIVRVACCNSRSYFVNLIAGTTTKFYNKESWNIQERWNFTSTVYRQLAYLVHPTRYQDGIGIILKEMVTSATIAT